MSCKYFRKALLTRRSRVQRTPSRASKSVAQRLRFLARKNKRFASRISTMREDVEKMRASNAAVAEETLSEQISKLPQKQQECVRQCFAAAAAKKERFPL